MPNALVCAQPEPTPNDHPAVWDLVIDDITKLKGPHGSHHQLAIGDMRERDQVGLERYGTRLQPHNGRDNLIDAYQEALDLCAYLRTALYENWDSCLEEAYLAAIQNTLMIRAILRDRDQT